MDYMKIPILAQSPQVSFFKNCVTSVPESEISFDEFLNYIKVGTYGRLIRNYQDLKEKKGASDESVKLFKRTKIPAITYAGIFAARSNNKLLMPSNITILDLDHCLKPAELKDCLKKDPYVNAAFISPGGDGLKVVVKSEFGHDPHEYKNMYFSLIDYFSTTYQIPSKDARSNHIDEIKPGIDLSCSDLARLCILSSDSDLYVNLDAIFFKPNQDKSHSNQAILSPIKPIEDDIRKVVEQIEYNHLDITNGYVN